MPHQEDESHVVNYKGLHFKRIYLKEFCDNFKSALAHASLKNWIGFVGERMVSFVCQNKYKL